MVLKIVVSCDFKSLYNCDIENVVKNPAKSLLLPLYKSL